MASLNLDESLDQPKMPLSFDIAIEPDDAQVMVLPYDADFAGHRTNQGFLDLRGRPNLAREVTEASASLALRELLISLAQPSSAWFSVGCDIKLFEGEAQQMSGYLQLAASDLHGKAQSLTHHLKLGARLKTRLGDAIGRDTWSVRYGLARINPADLGGPSLVWSPVIEFSAIDANDPAPSAERLISSVSRALA